MSKPNPWILVTTILPQSGVYVEVRVVKHLTPKVWRMKHVGYTDGNEYFWDDGEETILQSCEVEAWRPLSRPPTPRSTKRIK